MATVEPIRDYDHTIAGQIERLQKAKSDLKAAIENKGVTVPSSTKLDGYADLVDSIVAGGGDNTDEWTYIKCNTLVTGTDPNTRAMTKFYIQYTNSSNLIVEFISTINYTTHTWRSNKLVSTEPTDSIDFETWYRIKPNNMSVGDTGTLTITQTTGTVVYTFKLIKTFSETTELDVSATNYGADIEKFNVNENVNDDIWYYNSSNAKYKLIGGPDRWDIINMNYLFGYSEEAYFEFNGEKYYIDNFNDGTHTLSKQGQPVTCNVSRFVTFIIRKQSNDTYTVELMED